MYEWYSSSFVEVITPVGNGGNNVIGATIAQLRDCTQDSWRQDWRCPIPEDIRSNCSRLHTERPAWQCVAVPYEQFANETLSGNGSTDLRVLQQLIIPCAVTDLGQGQMHIAAERIAAVPGQSAQNLEYSNERPYSCIGVSSAWDWASMLLLRVNTTPTEAGELRYANLVDFLNKNEWIDQQTTTAAINLNILNRKVVAEAISIAPVSFLTDYYNTGEIVNEVVVQPLAGLTESSISSFTYVWLTYLGWLLINRLIDVKHYGQGYIFHLLVAEKGWTFVVDIILLSSAIFLYASNFSLTAGACDLTGKVLSQSRPGLNTGYTDASSGDDTVSPLWCTAVDWESKLGPADVAEIAASLEIQLTRSVAETTQLSIDPITIAASMAGQVNQQSEPSVSRAVLLTSHLSLPYSTCSAEL